MALLTTVNQSVFGFAPAAFGLLRDLTTGYEVPFAAAALCELAAAATMLAGRQVFSRAQAPILPKPDADPRELR